MNEELVQQMAASAARLAQAAEALEGAVTRLDAQQETMQNSWENVLQNKVAHILAAVDEKFDARVEAEADARAGEGTSAAASAAGGADELSQLRQQVEELSRANVELRAQSGHATRKTLTPAVSALLTKSGVTVDDHFDREVLDKALAPLSIEQRIAVKAEMARAGLIS